MENDGLDVLDECEDCGHHAIRHHGSRCYRHFADGSQCTCRGFKLKGKAHTPRWSL